MRIYMGFDDTDDKNATMGTGRLVREFVYGLDNDCHVIGVVRHQLPRLDNIPYTSNNSSACAIIEISPDSNLDYLREQATAHLHKHSAPGSDPGLCIARESKVNNEILEFSKTVTGLRQTQKDAMHAARSIELYGLGGTNDGIIGATAAVGLTKYGWCGRFIEYGRLRELGRELHVQDLHEAGIDVISTDRDPLVPLPGDEIRNAIWIRPSLWGGRPVLQVKRVDYGIWEPAHGKRKKGLPSATLRGSCGADFDALSRH
ncbi:hypothetical protein [Desulfovibrio sp. JC010]|uniref:hypothetical protein n=1 Tax=Desulfovibrio sp. JC010 TaxID=2593641 RepID=UPI0013D81221|nr:hypothetical protein [Desulfovibrio sp. JC010]NDV25262.1 hypothetical protein [Desulfovibrio sp. JC010]